MGSLLQFVNCKILRNHKIIKEDIWVRNGKIINPEKVFFEERTTADVTIDCNDNIIAPGFIELQLNGGFGYDFSYPDTVEEGIDLVSQKILSHGVTAFCPTLVTSPKKVYHTILSKIKKRHGGKHGAAVLGFHLEGPFINVEKKGAHPPEFIVDYEEGFSKVQEMYGFFDSVQIVTLAPEKNRSDEVIKELTNRNIIVSVGHTGANLVQGEEAVRNGASFITHLFNAMLPFHHRDPGIVGLLTSEKLPENKIVYYGIIADGYHTHPAALRIAYRTNPQGLVLVTDAMSALGLEDGKHRIGQMEVEVKNHAAYLTGTTTLAGSIASMIHCIKSFMKATGCTPEYALEAATLHPAKVLSIENTKGTLNFGADADFVILNNDFEVQSTWIAGECVYSNKKQCYCFIGTK